MRSAKEFGRINVLCGVLVVPFFQPLVWGQNAASPRPAVPTIVVDSPSRSDFGEFKRRAEGLQNPWCNGGYRYLDKPVVVADFVGGKVKAIRVVHLAQQNKAAKPDEIRSVLKKVWEGSFQSGFCQIAWAEAMLWSIEAVIEFEDGKRSALITDGVHVALQDHEGKSWFFRLYPAAQ